MKRWCLLLWLLLPLPVVVWHFGPGQKWLGRDQAHGLIQQAQQAERGKDWAQAERLFREALQRAGSEDPLLKARLEIALMRLRYRQGGAVEAIDLADRLTADPKLADLPAEVQREARELAGRIHYHAAWVLRLEGARRELWMEEAELARQNFRLLSEEGFARAEAVYATQQQTNLESAVRLERLSLVELMGRPLPEEGQAMAGQGLSEQMARRRGQRGQQPAVGEGDEGPPASGAGTQRFPGGPGS